MNVQAGFRYPAPNELRYVKRRVRSTGSLNLITLFLSGSFIVGGVVALPMAFLTPDDAIFLSFGGVCCILVGWFTGHVAWGELRDARSVQPRPVVRIEGALTVQRLYDEPAPVYFLDGLRIVVPDHWRPVLDRSEGQNVSAEAVPGTGPEFLVLSIDDRLSVSRDVESGLLSLPSKGLIALLSVPLLLLLTALFVAFGEAGDRGPFIRKSITALGGVSTIALPWLVTVLVRGRLIGQRLRKRLSGGP